MYDDWVPTYETCVKNGDRVVAVADVVMPHKGGIVQVWEVTHTHALTARKVKLIQEVLGDDIAIYEIEASWIMMQDVHAPPQDLYKAALKAAKAHGRKAYQPVRDKPSTQNYATDCIFFRRSDAPTHQVTDVSKRNAEGLTKAWKKNLFGRA